MWILNLALSYALWKVSDMYFQIKRPFLGWFCVATSAANAAVVMTHFF